MSPWVIPIVVLVVVTAAFVLARVRGLSKGGDGQWPFYLKKPLSDPEQVLYHRLVAAIPDCIILAQGQLSRVLGVKKEAPFHEWNNRINRMSLDFLVCLKDSTVVAAIELDDSSHDRSSRVEADARKDKALVDAGVTVIRWSVNAIPNEAAIRAALAQ